VDDTLPFDLWFLEIDQKTDGPTGGSKVVEALCDVLVAEVFHAFQLDHEHVLDEGIGKVFSDIAAFVGY
jgi:hypothetical protein